MELFTLFSLKPQAIGVHSLVRCAYTPYYYQTIVIESNSASSQTSEYNQSIMRAFFNLAVASATAFFAQTIAAPMPIVVTPGGKGDLIITQQNTVNHTFTALSQNVTIQEYNPLKISLVNNFGGGQLNVYVSGNDPSGAVVMLSSDGTWYHPDAAGSQVPVAISGNVALPMNAQGQTTEFTLPDYISSGRIGSPKVNFSSSPFLPGMEHHSSSNPPPQTLQTLQRPSTGVLSNLPTPRREVSTPTSLSLILSV